MGQDEKKHVATPVESNAPHNDREFIRDLVTGLVEGMQRRNPSDLDLTGMSGARQQALVSPQPGTRYRRVPGIGVEGSTFDFVVQEVAGFPNGKIIGLQNYKHPDGMLRPVSQGGKVPDGMQIALDRTSDLQIALAEKNGVEVSNNLCALPYVMWKLQNFWYADMKYYQNKDLKAHFCDPAGAGLKTPWNEAAHPEAEAAE